MKQSLHLGLGQQLRMTPQLQQAIRLLQLSSLELEQEIRETLYNNPLLEMDEQSETESLEQPEPEAAEVEFDNTNEADDREIDYLNFRDTRQNKGPEDDRPEFEDTQPQSLQEYLLWQLNLTPSTSIDRQIGEVIIDAVDPSGTLNAEIREIHDAFEDDEVTEEEVLAVLHRIQRFDPPGVACRSLEECLAVQLSLLPQDDSTEIAQLIVGRYLEFLPKLGTANLAKRMRRTPEEVELAVSLLKSLNPKPGYNWSSETPEYIIPDIVVSRSHGQWKVSLNPQLQSRLRVNEDYASMVKQKTSEASTRDYLRTHLQEARWFIRSLESRNDTLLRVASAIVEYQSGFFDQGPEAMRPLILRDLAEKLELHESTISRATSHKYMMSPRGLFELKYFFSSQLSTTTGGETSSTAIRALISRLIKDENPAKPLSDSRLTKLIEDQGIKVARRTIAKYRELEGIPPSSERRRVSVL